MFNELLSWPNLLRAAKNAMKGKRGRPDVQRFCFHLETELLELRRELTEGTYAMRPYRLLFVCDPKPRKICAAAFRDRVVHHAVCNVLAPVLEGDMCPYSYACRPGYGVHKAIAAIRACAGRYAYYLQSDIAKYYDNIEHARLLRSLAPKIPDSRMLGLLERITRHPIPGGMPGKGIPIGNLTSQYFANYYLTPLDRLWLGCEGVKAYVRYMDDMLVFANDKPGLHVALKQARDFLSLIHI